MISLAKQKKYLCRKTKRELERGSERERVHSGGGNKKKESEIILMI